MEIINQAYKALNNSYSPYSKFKVGCAILLNNGEYILGCNIENVSYSLSICAERVALNNLYSKGYKKEDIKMMAICSSKDFYITPCGACRQVMLELLNKDTKIILIKNKEEYKEVTVKELIPYGFESFE